MVVHLMHRAGRRTEVGNLISRAQQRSLRALIEGERSRTTDPAACRACRQQRQAGTVEVPDVARHMRVEYAPAISP